jgi:undecaprenyl-diphosphatase
MEWIHVVILALIQGLTELLPVSSSAHVIVAAKFLHEDMSTPANSLLLVLLHTGTMFAVIVYFGRRWRTEFLSSWQDFYAYVRLVFVACLFSGIVAVPVMEVVVHVLSHGGTHADIEVLFRKLNWIAPALAIVGVLIIYAGLREARRPETSGPTGTDKISLPQALEMGILQGFAIPFRGFSRSGSTISGGLLSAGRRAEVESFSFAIGVAITPLAIGWELRRVYHTASKHGLAVHWGPVLTPGVLGMVCAFIAGLLALKWLSRWLEQGRWYLFGIYCLAAAAVVQVLYWRGW